MNKHVVYVPRHHIEVVRDMCVDLAGGVTLSDLNVGYWKDDLGRLVSENIVIVTVFEEGRKALTATLTYLFEQKETAVAYEKNGVPRVLNYSTFVDLALL